MMNTEQTTPVPLTQKEWDDIARALANEALRRVKQFPEDRFGGGENWKTSYTLGYAEAAFRRAEREPLKNARRVALAMAVQAHRRTADIIEAEPFTGALKWEGNR